LLPRSRDFVDVGAVPRLIAAFGLSLRVYRGRFVVPIKTNLSRLRAEAALADRPHHSDWPAHVAADNTLVPRVCSDHVCADIATLVESTPTA